MSRVGKWAQIDPVVDAPFTPNKQTNKQMSENHADKVRVNEDRGRTFKIQFM